jgi:hypothetical protein
MTPIALTDRQMAELRQAAETVPYELRERYLERVAARLRGQDLGDGVIHRVAFEVAREMIWDAGRRAIG